MCFLRNTAKHVLSYTVFTLYSTVNQTWVIAETTGVQVIGTYGHSSVLDPRKNVIYVHAGFSVAMKSSSEFMTNSLYQYDLVKKEW